MTGHSRHHGKCGLKQLPSVLHSQGFLLGPFGNLLQKPVLGKNVSLFTIPPAHVRPLGVGDFYQEVGVVGSIDGVQALLVEHLTIGDHSRKVPCPLDSLVPGKCQLPELSVSTGFPALFLVLFSLLSSSFSF